MPVNAETYAMLSWLKTRLKPVGDVPGHPLGSEADISAWLAELPANPQRILQAVDEWLEDPEHLARQLDSEQMARAVGRLDEFVQPSVTQCWQEILKEARGEQRSALPTRPLESYYSHCHASCRYVLHRLEGNRDLGQEKKLLARFAARAMRSWVNLKKLAHMSYRAPTENWWGEAHDLNRKAHELAILYVEQHLYRDDPIHSSPWKEYMAGLLLDTLPLSNLAANQIEAAARLVVWIEPRCQYVDTQTTLSLFSIDPEGTQGPVRCRNEGGSAGLRYLGPGAGYHQLVQLSKNLHGDESMPAWLETAGLTMTELKELLQTVLVHWSPNPPKRRQPRHSGSGKLLVVHGLSMVRRMIAASEFVRSGRSLDYEGFLRNIHLHHPDDPVLQDVPPPPKTPMEVLQLLESAGGRLMMDHWEIMDESERGLGIHCPVRRSWHSIGEVVGYRLEEGLEWHVAIIRRLGSSHGSLNAGLATFQCTPLCSQVRIGESKGTADVYQFHSKGAYVLNCRDAVLLPEEAKLMLAPPGSFKADHSIEISVGGRFRPVMMRSLQNKGKDYELIQYDDAGDGQPA